MSKLRFTVAAFALLTGCTSAVQDGFHAYSSGQFDVAASHWNEPAKRGDATAQYNLGVLWENGQGSTPKNLTQAANWYVLAAKQGYVPAMVSLARVQLQLGGQAPALTWLELAARWNDPNARALLVSMGHPVPAADLYAAAETQRLAGQQALASGLGTLAYGATCTIGGGCAPLPGTSPQRPAPGSVSFKCRPMTLGEDNPLYKCEN